MPPSYRGARPTARAGPHGPAAPRPASAQSTPRSAPGDLKARAGLPATTPPGGTSFVTTAPAPTSAPSPIVTPHRMTAPLPIDARRPTHVGTTVHSVSVLGLPS